MKSARLEVERAHLQFSPQLPFSFLEGKNFLSSGLLDRDEMLLQPRKFLLEFPLLLDDVIDLTLQLLQLPFAIASPGNGSVSVAPGQAQLRLELLNGCNVNVDKTCSKVFLIT